MKCCLGKPKTSRRTVSVALSVALLAVRLAAQVETLRVDVDLVNLYVTVTDKAGKPVEGLGKENFHVLEDNVQQEVRHFTAEDTPFTIGMVLDRSGSMMMVIDDVYRAALNTLEASKPEDEAFVIVFNNRVQLIQDFTSDRKALDRALRKVDAGGQTALYDAVYTASNHVRKGKHRKKALLVVTDGADNSSQVSYSELLNFAKQSEVIVHVIGFFGDTMRFGSLLEESPDADKLKRLAEVTGGRAYFPRTMQQCRQACLDTASELRQQYSLGYYPSNRNKDGTWRKIRIEVVGVPPERANEMIVRTREGYYASTT